MRKEKGGVSEKLWGVQGGTDRITPPLHRAHNKAGGVAAPPSKYSGGEGYDVIHRAKEFDDQFSDVYNTYTAYAFKVSFYPNKTTQGLTLAHLSWGDDFRFFLLFRFFGANILVAFFWAPGPVI